MVSIKTFRAISLSFPDTTELPHFQKTSFRNGHKIFATLDEQKFLATLKLSLVDQSVFCSFDKSIIFPVPNKWGLQGWTNFKLQKSRKSMIMDAVTCAFNETKKVNLRK